MRDKLTSEEGQLEENPYYTLKQAREAAQREYNRRNAARGRLRRKCMLSELQEKYAGMENEIQALREENTALKAERAEICQVVNTRSAADSHQGATHIPRPVHEVHRSQLGVLQHSPESILNDARRLQNLVYHSRIGH